MKELSQKSEWFVKYHGYLLTQMQRNQYDKKKYAFILMQCAEQNLEQFLVERRGYRRRLRTGEMVSVLEQVLQALAALEEIHIAHCDIKPENILIMDRESLTIRLCDVGSCKVVDRDSEDATILGTVPFLAPELVRVRSKKLVSSNPFKSDVFSFGLVVLYMVTFKKFKSHERMEIEESAYREVVQEWVKEAKELCDGDTTICEVLRVALEFDEFKRTTFKELKFVCFNEKKKRDILRAGFLGRL
jgi:serine/threonine protein kinase